MKASTPNWFCAGFQLYEKMPQPSVVNHDEAWLVVVMAIRTRITSTSRPAPSARYANRRSPSGRRRSKGEADPAGTAGSTFVATLMMTDRSCLSASENSSSRGYLVELSLGHSVEVRRQRRVAELLQRGLTVADQVADVGLEHARGVRARLHLVDEDPALVSDRVRLRARPPDRVEREVRRDRDTLGRRRRPRRGGGDVVAVLVLDRGGREPGGLGVGVVHVPDGPGGGLDDLCHPAVAAAGAGAGGPLDRRAAAERPDGWHGRLEEQGEVLRGTRGVRADGGGDRGARQGDTGVERRDRRVVPGLDIALEDVRDNRRVQLQVADARQVVRHRDRTEQDGEVQHRLALEVRLFLGGDGRVGARELDHV